MLSTVKYFFVASTRLRIRSTCIPPLLSLQMLPNSCLSWHHCHYWMCSHCCCSIAARRYRLLWQLTQRSARPSKWSVTAPEIRISVHRLGIRRDGHSWSPYPLFDASHTVPFCRGICPPHGCHDPTVLVAYFRGQDGNRDGISDQASGDPFCASSIQTHCEPTPK